MQAVGWASDGRVNDRLPSASDSLSTPGTGDVVDVHTYPLDE